MKLTQITKAVVAALPLVVTVVHEVAQAIDNGSADGTFTSADLLTVIVAALTPILVYLARNTTHDPVVAQTQSVTLVPPVGPQPAAGGYPNI